MTLKLTLTLFALVALAASACASDGEPGSRTQRSAVEIILPTQAAPDAPYFTPAEADRIAHASLPVIDDLPGEGWEVVARDEFGNGAHAGIWQFIEAEPACQTLHNLSTIERLFSGGALDTTSGRASIEIQRRAPDAVVPTSIEAEIEIDRAASQPEGSWRLAKELLESGETSACFAAFFNSLMMQELGAESGVEVEVTAAKTAAETPRGGIGLAFQIDMLVAGFEFDMMMQMYFWPYANAGVQALFLGASGALTAELVGGVLGAIDEKLTAAAGEEQEASKPAR